MSCLYLKLVDTLEANSFSLFLKNMPIWDTRRSRGSRSSVPLIIQAHLNTQLDRIET
jgi:hypothetical protein